MKLKKLKYAVLCPGAPKAWCKANEVSRHHSRDEAKQKRKKLVASLRACGVAYMERDYKIVPIRIGG